MKKKKVFIVKVLKNVKIYNNYPFGLEHKGYNNVVTSTNPAQNYKYNGKEHNEELGLDWYDYGARFYDPALGRWFTPDALAEKFYSTSPFTYGLNNPIIYIDPDGNQVEMCCQGLKDFVKGIGDAGAAFNTRVANFTNDFTNSPVQTTLDAANNVAVGTGQLIHDVVPGLSMITGIENKTGNAMMGAVDAITDLPNATPREAGSLLGAGMLAAGESILTKKSPVKTTSRAARREAMRKEGIPTSQQPSSQSKNSSGREYTYETPKAGGGTLTKSVQQQTMDRSHKDQPHWEAGKVKTDNGNVRTNNYGRPKLQNDKSKVDYDN